MKIYYMTSERFTGEIELKYDENGYLLNYDNRAQLNKEQIHWFLSNLPRTFNDLQILLKQTTTAKLTEVKQNITFEMFWNKYDDKINSSKKRTETKWNKMPESERIKAYNFVNKYLSAIPYGTRKKFAEKYLNDELWNN